MRNAARVSIVSYPESILLSLLKAKLPIEQAPLTSARLRGAGPKLYVPIVILWMKSSCKLIFLSIP